MKGFVVAGTGSGVGKTSITTGLMHILSKKMKVQGFKVGPDFIDPMYHKAATGRYSRNLDTFMMSHETISNLAHFTSQDSDISIVEGVRGLYEGSTGLGEEGSTAEVAKTLGLPVILVVNARSLTRSAAAIIQGFKAFDKEVNIAGVILNQVSGDQHERKLREAVTHYTDVKILGVVRRTPQLKMKERYLGLDTVTHLSKEVASDLENMLCDVDMDALNEISAGTENEGRCPYARRKLGLKAAIPMDDAYCFYYRENIECMMASGVEIEYFSPLKGDPLPNADIYYIGGGYPELYLDPISENQDFLQGLKNASDEGKMVMGECGGLMTLCSSMTDKDGKEYKGAGVFDARAEMVGVRHGPSYVIAQPNAQNPLFAESVRGHEFHYSRIIPGKDVRFGFDMGRGEGIINKMDGMVYKNSLGTYMHQHALSVKDWMGKISEL
jgi:cobyrinic acid a,c-diamide synthase